MIIGVGTDFWGNALFTHPTHLTMLEAEFIPHHIKLVPVIFSLSGAISAFIFYMNYSDKLYQFKISKTGRNLYTFLNRKWFFDKVYNDFIAQSMLNFGYHTSYKLIDRGVFEFLGPLGLSRLVSRRGSGFSPITNRIFISLCICNVIRGYFYNSNCWFMGHDYTINGQPSVIHPNITAFFHLSI